MNYLGRDNRIDGLPALDIAQVDTQLVANVTLLSPPSVPLVADNPVLDSSCGVSSPADCGHGVSAQRRRARTNKDSTPL